MMPTQRGMSADAHRRCWRQESQSLPAGALANYSCGREANDHREVVQARATFYRHP